MGKGFLSSLLRLLGSASVSGTGRRRSSDYVHEDTTNGLESAVNKLTGLHLTGAENEANAFSAQQAQIARDWQEQMYNQYESPAAMMRQYQEAGINPAMVAGGTMPSMNTTTSAPSSVTPASESLVGAISQLAMLKSQIKGNEAQADLFSAEAERNRNESTNIALLTPYQVQQAEVAVRKLNQDISESEAHTDVLVAQRLLSHQEYHFKEYMNQLQTKAQELANAKSEGEIFRLEAEIKQIQQETSESMARELVDHAQKGLLDQETANACEQLGLIKIDKEKGQFEVDTQRASLTWSRLETGARAVGTVLGGALGIIGITKADKVAKVTRALGYSGKGARKYR